MYPVTTAWTSAVTASHTVSVYVDVLWRGGVQLRLSTVTGGSVEVERTAIRRQASVTVVDPGDGTLIATSPMHPLNVYGAELRIWRGVVYPNGTEEVIPIFTGPITDVDEDYPEVTIRAMDRSDTISSHRFEVPNVIGAGTNYVTAITRVLTAAKPDIDYSFPSSNIVTPQLLFEEQGDPWEAAKKMAASLGNELLFDVMGVCRMTAEPATDPANPLFTFVEGDNASFPTEAARSVLVGVSRSRTNRSRFNKVIATGENTDNSAVYRAEAWDADPGSPTYIGGEFGVRPRWYASQYITSNAQAAAAARSVLRSELGQTDQIPFQIVPNAALDIGDPVRVVRPKAGIDALRTIDKLSIPLAAGEPMEIVTRAMVAIEDETG